MACILHRPSKAPGDVIVPFLDVTLARAQKCCQFWKKTSWALEVAIAERFEEAIQEGLAPYGYHNYCYTQFTKKSRMQKARTEASSGPKASVTAMAPPKNAFPRQCVFCAAHIKATLNRCSTPDLAAKILAAAAERKDRRLLELLAGEDLVARRLAYHTKCYLRYTYNSPYALAITLPATVEAAFRDFVANGITTVERSGMSCVPVTALGPLFMKTVADTGAYSDYQGKVGYLITNLKKYCPYPLYAGGKVGGKPTAVCSAWKQDEGDAVWENNGEAVDFQGDAIGEGGIACDAREDMDCREDAVEEGDAKGS